MSTGFPKFPNFLAFLFLATCCCVFAIGLHLFGLIGTSDCKLCLAQFNNRAGHQWAFKFIQQSFLLHLTPSIYCFLLYLIVVFDWNQAWNHSKSYYFHMWPQIICILSRIAEFVCTILTCQTHLLSFSLRASSPTMFLLQLIRWFEYFLRMRWQKWTWKGCRTCCTCPGLLLWAFLQRCSRGESKNNLQLFHFHVNTPFY